MLAGGARLEVGKRLLVSRASRPAQPCINVCSRRRTALAQHARTPQAIWLGSAPCARWPGARGAASSSPTAASWRGELAEL